MPNTTVDDPVCVSAREFPGVGTSVWVWRAVSVTFKRDGGHSDYWSFGKTLLKIVVLWRRYGMITRYPADANNGATSI